MTPPPAYPPQAGGTQYMEIYGYQRIYKNRKFNLYCPTTCLHTESVSVDTQASGWGWPCRPKAGGGVRSLVIIPTYNEKGNIEKIVKRQENSFNGNLFQKRDFTVTVFPLLRQKGSRYPMIFHIVKMRFCRNLVRKWLSLYLPIFLSNYFLNKHVEKAGGFYKKLCEMVISLFETFHGKRV